MILPRYTYVFIISSNITYISWQSQRPTFSCMFVLLFGKRKIYPNIQINWLWSEVCYYDIPGAAEDALRNQVK